MDLSKLPRLSNSAQASGEQKPPEQAQPPAAAPQPVQPTPTPPVQMAVDATYSPGAEAFISFAIGGIGLLLQPRLLQFVLAKMGIGQFTWTFNDRAGQPLAYVNSAFFWHDAAVTAFCASMFIVGVLYVLMRSVALLKIEWFIMLVAGVLNAVVLVGIRGEIGFQLFPAVAAAYCIYRVLVLRSALRALRQLT